MRELLLGNEAVARGAHEAGVWCAAAYPGTPSSEIMETIGVQYPDIKSEWSINEKVALEVALGSAIAGARTICVMKHVGLNVAADPFMTAAYTGTTAGLTIVVADDPSLHSSQNEQDTRNYAKFGRVPLFEPSDSQEAKDFVKISMEVGEQFETVSILRTVTRISHTKTAVELFDPDRTPVQFNYEKNPKKFVMIPGHARPRHEFVLERWEKLKEYSNSFQYNREEMNDSKIGIVTHGLAYQYVKEALPDASVFKVSMYPVPVEAIKKFAEKVDKLYVVEELDPIIESELRFAGVELAGGKDIIPEKGELSVDIIKKAFGYEVADKSACPSALPPRPPQLCQGCGHITIFEVLNEIGATVSGDIGCYTLGVLPPYSAMDTTICMGASVGVEEGMQKVAGLTGEDLKSVSVIGDSTFFHSGMTGLLNAVYNQTPMTLIIMDNRITAMTGHQPSPNTGLNSNLELTVGVDIEGVVKGLGVKRVRKILVRPKTKEEFKQAVLEEMAAKEPSVIIADEICVIAEPKLRKTVGER